MHIPVDLWREIVSMADDIQVYRALHRVSKTLYIICKQWKEAKITSISLVLPIYSTTMIKVPFSEKLAMADIFEQVKPIYNHVPIIYHVNHDKKKIYSSRMDYAITISDYYKKFLIKMDEDAKQTFVNKIRVTVNKLSSILLVIGGKGHRILNTIDNKLLRCLYFYQGEIWLLKLCESCICPTHWHKPHVHNLITASKIMDYLNNDIKKLEG